MWLRGRSAERTGGQSLRAMQEPEGPGSPDTSPSHQHWAQAGDQQCTFEGAGNILSSSSGKGRNVAYRKLAYLGRRCQYVVGDGGIGNLYKGAKDGSGCRSRSEGYSFPERGWREKGKRGAGDGVLGGGEEKEAARRSSTSLLPGPGLHARCKEQQDGGVERQQWCQQGPQATEMKGPSRATTQGWSNRPRMPLTHTPTPQAK